MSFDTVGISSQSTFVLETCACHEVLRDGVCEGGKTSFVGPHAALRFFFACADHVQSGIIWLTKS